MSPNIAICIYGLIYFELYILLVEQRKKVQLIDFALMLHFTRMGVRQIKNISWNDITKEKHFYNFKLLIRRPFPPLVGDHTIFKRNGQ